MIFTAKSVWLGLCRALRTSELAPCPSISSISRSDKRSPKPATSFPFTAAIPCLLITKSSFTNVPDCDRVNEGGSVVMSTASEASSATERSHETRAQLIAVSEESEDTVAVVERDPPTPRSIRLRSSSAVVQSCSSSASAVVADPAAHSPSACMPKRQRSAAGSAPAVTAARTSHSRCRDLAGPWLKSLQRHIRTCNPPCPALP
mmetsp:Transcript_87967/g.264576  ORF Transcript_87967/g.264576 Transcript_87967/m.264576 type:complete len:204 (+) Transcript_87967:3871-4482(+)